MKQKYEVAAMREAEITVDVSLLSKTDEMYFNATEMAKPFGKRPVDWLRLPDTKAYIDALLEVGKSHFGEVADNTLSEGNSDSLLEGNETAITGNSGNYDNLVKAKKGGKYQGTWLHTDLSIAFARWLSPVFSVRLDKWTKNRIQQEHKWKQKRLETKTGFLPMTNAVLHAHDPIKHYHFSNEADLINRIVLGMSAKDFRAKYGVDCVRDGLDAAQLSEINRLQIINTGLIEIGMDYKERKEKLIECHKRGLLQLGYAA